MKEQPRTIFTYGKFYVHEIVAVILSKPYLLKNAKKRCKPNNCDLNCVWLITDELYKWIAYQSLIKFTVS